MPEKKQTYTADDIQVLEGLEPVRKRPGMYIGSTGPDGLHHLVREIFDNSRDEAMAGHADHIEVALLPNNYVRVIDNGRGIPVGKHKKTGVSALETIMTTLHAGGKFGGGGYKISGGLHGVGASVVNALSNHTKVLVHQAGTVYRQEYERGKKVADVKKIGKSDFTGTVISFQADDTIFSEVVYNWKRILNHYREQAYLVKGVKVQLIDARTYDKDLSLSDTDTLYLGDLHLPVVSKTYYFEGGLMSMVRHINRHQKPVQPNIFYVEKEVGDIIVEIAVQYVDDISPRLVSFANNISTPEGGMHVTGFKTALTRLLNNYNKKNKVLSEKDGNFTGDDVLEGMTAIISCKMPEIQFEGQTKTKLGTPEARGAVESVFAEAFTDYLEEHPQDAKSILHKIVLALRARKAAKAAKDSILRKGALEGFTLPGKLADCQTKSADEAELFIVEGDSAGGSAKQGRDRRNQAILPLRGKILNVERARLDRMIASNEIKNFVIALGTSIGDTFDIEKLRYKKIIIATDADVDGAHIRTLLLTLIYRYFRPLIDAGFIYIAQPPLYKIKVGKKIRYVFSDEEKVATLKELGATEPDQTEDNNDNSQDNDSEEVEAKNTKKASIQRYKGLGEMNPEELWETTMDPQNRIMRLVSVEDAQDADEIFDMLMGTDVSSRKSFIQTNAKLAEIDI